MSPKFYKTLTENQYVLTCLALTINTTKRSQVKKKTDRKVIFSFENRYERCFKNYATPPSPRGVYLHNLVPFY